LKNFLTIIILAIVSLNVTSCFSIGARSKMKDEHIKTYPGVAAYKEYVTRPFEELDTEDSIFFGILISPHLLAASLDLPFSFLIDSVMQSSDQKKVDEWENKPAKFFAQEWPDLVSNIEDAKLEDALKKIDNVGFKKFWKLLVNRPKEEKILFALLKFIDQAKKPSAEKYARNELRKFPFDDILKVMAHSCWKQQIVPNHNAKIKSEIRSYSLEGRKATFAIGLKENGKRSILYYYPEVFYIFEMPGTDSNSYVSAVKNKYQDVYDIVVLPGKPNGLKLPKVKIPRQELKNWIHGWGLSKWTEKYLPEELVEHFQFDDNDFGVPKVSE